MPFSGRATYDDFSNIGQDISDIMLIISARETPFLDVLPTPARPATSTKHLWREAALGPDHIIASTAVNSAIADTGIQVNGVGGYLQVGMQLELETSSGNQEVVSIKSIAGPNSILVARNFGTTGINSLAAGGQLFVIATSELEGDDLAGDVSRPRTERENYTQIFKKPITVSGTERSVQLLPDTGDEFDYQTTLRAIELARDLEKALLRGVSVNTTGSGSLRRSMGGLRSYLTAINSTVVATSFATAPVDYVNDGLQQAWNAGARDLDVLVVGAQWKRDISASNASRYFIEQTDNKAVRRIDMIATDFGELRVILTPWLPDRHMMGVATRRIFPVPLRGRSFRREDLAKTGDASKAHIVGEYTVEIHHPQAMFQMRGA